MLNFEFVHELQCVLDGLVNFTSSNLTRHEVNHLYIDHIPIECLQPARDISLGDDSEDCLTIVGGNQGPGLVNLKLVDHIADQDIKGDRRD